MVFNRFWRADPARARTTGGTGLGLSISLEDARLHGGWLQAWGEPGKGAQFRLTLPRRAGDPIVKSPLPLVPGGRGDASRRAPAVTRRPTRLAAARVMLRAAHRAASRCRTRVRWSRTGPAQPARDGDASTTTRQVRRPGDEPAAIVEGFLDSLRATPLTLHCRA